MYTLYYLPGTCSMAVHVVLNELGLNFKLENVAVEAGKPRPESFLKLNPRGSVPVLQQDDFVLREGAAVLTWLLDEHDGHLLLPPEGEERARVLEWLSFGNATLHPAYARIFFMHRNLGDQAAANPLYGLMIESIQKLWDEVEQHLAQQEYLAGKICSVADILLTVIANWTPNLRQPVQIGPKTKALFARVIARPAYQKALATEAITYKMAA